jgi:hypothetical protein
MGPTSSAPAGRSIVCVLLPHLAARTRFWSTGSVEREYNAGDSRKRRSRKEVRRLVDEFEASGLERVEFCREFCRSRNLALSTLQRHLRARRSATGAASGRPRIVAVSVTPRVETVSQPAETKLEVVLSRGRRIGVRPGFDAGTLRELTMALEEA